MTRILFVCVHNSARSQMAEGLARHLGKGTVEAYSAGTQATQVNPYAIEAMAEIGIDISKHRSKTIEELKAQIDDVRQRLAPSKRSEGGSTVNSPPVYFDYVITLCSEAEAECPYVPGSKMLHWPLPDPSRINGSRESALEAFRNIRNEIETRIKDFLGPIAEKGG